MGKSEGTRRAKSEGTRRAKRRSHPIVRGDGYKVSSVEVVQLPNKKVKVVRGEGIVLLQMVESDEGKGSREIPPKDVKRGARILGRTNDMHHQSIERKGWGDMDLDYDQGVMVDSRAPLKVMECTNKKRGHSKTGV